MARRIPHGCSSVFLIRLGITTVHSIKQEKYAAGNSSLVVWRVSVMKRNVPGSAMKKSVSGATVWLQSEATSSLDEPWRICNVLYETFLNGSYRNGT